MGLGHDSAPLANDERGSLEHRALPDLLCSICTREQTGILHLIRFGIIKSIYIDKGRIVFASSTDKDDRLGELLLRRGLLRVHQIENALALQTKQKRLGGLLVEMGYLAPEALVQTIVDQVRDIVFGLFLWTEGDYRFEARELPTREVITLRLSTPEVILGGIRRIDRWWRVLGALGGLDAVFHARSRHEKILEQMRPSEEQTRIVEALQKPIRVRDLCGLGILPDFDACRTLWAFRVVGIAEPTDEPAQHPPMAEVLGERAEPEAAEELDEALGSDASSGDDESIDLATPASEKEAPSVDEVSAYARELAGGGSGEDISLETPSDEPEARDEALVLKSGIVGLAEEDPLASQATPARAIATPPDESEDAEVEVVSGESDQAMPPTALAPAKSTAPAPPAAASRAKTSPVPPSAASAKSHAPAPPSHQPPPTPPTKAAPERPPVDDRAVTAQIEEFHAQQRRLFEILQEKMGSMAAGLVGRALKGMAGELPGLFKDVVGQPDGTLAADVLKANLSKLKMDPAGLGAALGLLIERELEAVAGLLGPATRRQIASDLKHVPV